MENRALYSKAYDELGSARANLKRMKERRDAAALLDDIEAQHSAAEDVKHAASWFLAADDAYHTLRLNAVTT